MAFKLRIALPWGWAESASPKRVRLGEHMVPAAVTVHFEGVDGQPALDMQLAVIDGRPQCRELRITSHGDGREVRQLDLRAVNLDQWVTEIYAEIALPILDEDDKGNMTLGWIVADDERHLESVRTMQRARRGKGARKLNRAFLERVAATYTEHIDGAPTKAVAEAFGVEHRQASNYVQRARGEGLLGPTTPGKKGT